MSYSEKPSVTPRPTFLPPGSCSLLQHQSLLPLHIINPIRIQIPLHAGNQTVYHIIPKELFYSNPTMGSGMRIWNTPPGIRVFRCPQLNTPQPIMSPHEAPPNVPDPFRSGPHPTRDLGSLSWRIQSSQPLVQPRQAIIQLTAEEDQAVTNLLKLHHQEAAETTVPAAHLDLSGLAESSPGCSAPSSSVCVDARYPERRRRVEAALLSGFNQQDADLVKTPNKTAVPDGPPQKPGTLSVWPKIDEHENTAPLRPVNLEKRRRWEELTDLEEDAVSVLLSLSDSVKAENLRSFLK